MLKLETLFDAKGLIGKRASIILQLQANQLLSACYDIASRDLETV